MKRWIFFLSFITVSFFVEAKSVKTEWSCAKGASDKIEVEVSFDATGEIKFQPDIFSGILKVQEGIDYSYCMENFQKEIDRGLTTFKQEECPVSKDPLCFSSNDYVNSKVIESLLQSKFLSSNKTIKLKRIDRVAAAKILDSVPSPQSYLEEKIAQRKIDAKNLLQTFQYLGKTYQVSDFDKIIADNVDNIFSDLNFDESKQYAQNYMVAKSDFLKSDANPAKRKEVMDNLEKMFGHLYGDKSSVELAKILECAPEDQFSPLEKILEEAAKSRKVDECKSLNSGEHKVFKMDRRDFRTNDYLLRRKTDGNYEALLNVKFVSNGSKVTAYEMMERSKKCLVQASPYLKGPNGQMLEVKILSPDETNKLPRDHRPRYRTVSIEPGPEFRSSSLEYGENANCGTIVHEVLHLLGLCDEYPETFDNNLGYTCRVVPTRESIMKDSQDFYKRVVGSANACECISPLCKTITISKDENLKKFFVSKNFIHFAGNEFKNQYCSFEPLPTIQNIPSPEKATILSSDNGDSFAVEERSINSISIPPFYRINRYRQTCKCPSSDTKCLTKKKKIVAALVKGGNIENCPSQHMKSIGVSEKKTTILSPTEIVISYEPDPSIRSLIQPNHFKKILAGNCKGAVSSYEECSEFAYISAKDKKCNVPDKCLDDNYYLGSEQ